MSTKINVRSPFHYKVTGTNVDLVELTMYVYSGTKETDKGDPKHVIRPVSYTHLTLPTNREV